MSDTLARLRKRAIKVVTIKDENAPDNEAPYEFTIQPLSTFDLIETENITDQLPENGEVINEEKMDEKTFTKMKNSVFPMMKKFIPVCLVSPKVTFEQSEVNDETLHIREIPFNVVSQLFNEVLKLSGLDKDSVEEAKKKQAAQSSST